jgi:hypothetical protein
MAGFQECQLPDHGVGDELLMTSAVAFLEDRQLPAWVDPFAAHDDPHPVRPTTQTTSAPVHTGQAALAAAPEKSSTTPTGAPSKSTAFEWRTWPKGDAQTSESDPAPAGGGAGTEAARAHRRAEQT